MAVSIVEAAKRGTGDVYRDAVMEEFGMYSPVLEVLPFQTIAGNALKYNREETLPGIGFRGINEGFTESTGVLNPQTESLYITGGDLDVDSFIMRTMGAGIRASQEAMKIKALSLNWTRVFFKGDNVAEPREFDGLQTRITGNQKIVAGTSSGGDALSLTKLDQLLDTVHGVNALFMNKTMRRRLTAAARTTTVGGYVTYTQDAFGRRLTAYNDVPIYVLDEDNDGNQILDFGEANPSGGTAASTSIYAVATGDGMLTGIQSGMMNVRDLGELQTKPAVRTRIEWDAGIACFTSRSVGRLHGIKDAAVVA